MWQASPILLGSALPKWSWVPEESNPWPFEQRTGALSTRNKNSWRVRIFNWIKINTPFDSHFITEQKIHHVYSLINTNDFTLKRKIIYYLYLQWARVLRLPGAKFPVSTWYRHELKFPAHLGPGGHTAPMRPSSPWLPLTPGGPTGPTVLLMLLAWRSLEHYTLRNCSLYEDQICSQLLPLNSKLNSTNDRKIHYLP